MAVDSDWEKEREQEFQRGWREIEREAERSRRQVEVQMRARERHGLPPLETEAAGQPEQEGQNEPARELLEKAREAIQVLGDIKGAIEAQQETLEQIAQKLPGVGHYGE